jgi:hypothetical protein
MELLVALVVAARREPERAVQEIHLAHPHLKEIMVEMALHRQIQTRAVAVAVPALLETALLIMLLATVALERPQPSLEHL